MSENPLGKKVTYADKYMPELLVGIPRQHNRDALELLAGKLPFMGADIWNAYELSCLDTNGRPRNFVGRFVFPADSKNLVESKSLKLYLNSLNQEKFESAEHFSIVLAKDLSTIAGKDVDVAVFLPEETAQPELPAGTCLDHLDIAASEYHVNPKLLKRDGGKGYE
ncbi:MAG: NADPH-dependent 7-cyano-7-deazaguanine reductase QueF, partial [Gammaproteobacteria bacterium]|nr:NADPH-dependent 7-cyano-7-deazaguanine reductase QueF [Gammaproteobacteria bacterium]